VTQKDVTLAQKEGKNAQKDVHLTQNSERSIGMGPTRLVFAPPKSRFLQLPNLQSNDQS
jgi:hypothetical protein